MKRYLEFFRNGSDDIKKLKLFLVVITFFFCDFVYAGCMKEISITGYELVPKFNTNTHKYNVFINGNSILIKGKSKNDNSTISGLGNFDVLSDKSEFIIKCDNEKYVIKTFKEGYVEDGSDAHLSSLEIIGSKIDFDKNKFHYEVIKNNELDIEYDLSDDRATALITENANNEIIISVTSYDKSNNLEYIIKVNELENVSGENTRRNKVREMKTSMKVVVILFLSFGVLTIMNFVRKKIF